MTKREAERSASALCKKLRGDGWKPRVWENMGWHYHAVAGTADGPRIEVWEGLVCNCKWHCLIYGGNAVGNSQWSTRGGHSDPNRAVEVELRAFNQFMRRARTVGAIVKALAAGWKAGAATEKGT